MTVYVITTASGDIWFDDCSGSFEEATIAANATFGCGCRVEQYSSWLLSH